MLLSLLALVLAAQEAPPPAPPEPDFGRPVWVERPTAADVLAAYPVSAYETGRGGTVTMMCRATISGRLDRCEVISDTAPVLPGDIAHAFRLTGHFLHMHVWDPRQIEPPATRDTLIEDFNRL